MTEKVCTISPTVGHNFITNSPLTLYFAADTEETQSTDTDVPSLKGEEVQQGKGEGDGNDISVQEEDIGE